MPLHNLEGSDDEEEEYEDEDDDDREAAFTVLSSISLPTSILHQFHFQHQYYINFTSNINITSVCITVLLIRTTNFIIINILSFSPLKISSTEGRQPILQFAET